MMWWIPVILLGIWLIPIWIVCGAWLLDKLIGILFLYPAVGWWGLAQYIKYGPNWEQKLRYKGTYGEGDDRV